MAFRPEMLRDIGLLFFVGGSSDLIVSYVGAWVQALAPWGALAFVAGAIWAMWQ